MFAQGAHAIKFRQAVVAALNANSDAPKQSRNEQPTETQRSRSVAPSPHPAPAAQPPAEPGSSQSPAPASAEPPPQPRERVQPRLWTVDEETQLINEYTEGVFSGEQIAEKHQRSLYAIAVRLGRHRLLTPEQIEAVQNGQPLPPYVKSPAPTELDQRKEVAPQSAPQPPAPQSAKELAQEAPAAQEQPRTVEAPSGEPVEVLDEDSSWISSAEDMDDYSEVPQEQSALSVASIDEDLEAASGHAAAPESPKIDYELLYESELNRAPANTQQYIKSLLSRVEEQPHIANSMINLLNSDRMKEQVPEVLRKAFIQKIERFAKNGK